MRRNNNKLYENMMSNISRVLKKELLNEARVGALSISKLNHIIIDNMNKVNPRLLATQTFQPLDLIVFLKGGQNFRFIEGTDGSSQMQGYDNIPEEFITTRGNRFVGDYMEYSKLSTQKKKDFVAWLQSKEYELCYERFDDLDFESYYFIVIEVGTEIDAEKYGDITKMTRVPIDLFKY